MVLPTTVSLTDQSKTLQTSLLSHVGVLGKALVHGDLSELDVAKLNGIITAAIDINNRLNAAQASSTNGIYQSPAGKWVSSIIKITALFVIIICIGLSIYQNFIAPDSSSGSGFGTTITAGGAAVVHLLNDFFKQHSDTEATTLSLTPPKPLSKFKRYKL